jgi:hypothetical protein
LGESVPIDSLKDLKKYFDNITYICYTTVEPDKNEINNYIQKLNEEILEDTSDLWFIGRMIENIDPKYLTQKNTTFTSIKELVEYIE